ncbi:MAG TPA: histidine phosphatase family protein [Acidimicrobiales bacterium]|nr:histidine phosphatase family protein [Acidimicrobiales bacterium]
MARLLLIRHGQSAWNAEGRWQGWADPPLSDIGAAQALAAAERLRGEGLSAVASSDLQRARHTAEIIADCLDLPLLEPLPDLRERDIGDWSGLTTVEIEQGWPGWLALWRAGDLERPPNGEAHEELAARVVGALERLAEEDGCILVVTHGGVIHLVQDRLGVGGNRVGNLCGRWIEAGFVPGEAVLVPEEEARTTGIAL